MKRELDIPKQRDVILSYLCSVSPEYISKRWHINVESDEHPFVKGSVEWRDPLVEFYREEAQRGRKGSNAIHMYLAGQRECEGLPNIELVELNRDWNVYLAIEDDIFNPLEKGFTETGELQLIRSQFDAVGLFHQKLKEAYLSGIREPIDAAYREVNGVLTKMAASIEGILQTLDFREREVIRLRYRIGQQNKYTLEEVGRIFKISPEWVRQLETKALRKLQHPIELWLDGSVKQKSPTYETSRPDHNYVPTQVASTEPTERYLTDFDFSVRTRKGIERLGILTVGDLAIKTKQEILQVMNKSRMSLEEVENFLRGQGYSLSD